LISECPNHEEWKGNIEELKYLTQYSVSTRYPGIEEEITEAEAREAVEIARRTVYMIRSALKSKGYEFTDEELEK
jgi:hypothetical protein